VRDVERLAREIVGSKLKIRANCAARTVVGDVQPIVEVSQRVGLPIECCCFIGSSPIRRYAEDWTVDYLQRCTDEAVSFGVNHGLEVMYVTEDTTRSDPETLRKLFTTAIRAGASRICIADTVGHATPAGARAVVAFTRQIIDDMGGHVGIDWHGHRDRDMGTINSLAALEAGASRVHGTILGIGERVGNTPMDLLMVNLVLMGWIERDLTSLNDLVRAVSDATGEAIPDNYPVFGRDAFRTATGVHAAAVVKAFRKNDPELMDAVYSGVPAQMVGRVQQIEVGPLSGKSNVVFWLEQHGFAPAEEVVDRVFRRAKSSQRVLTEQEIIDEIHVAQTYASTRLDA
jgi:2-isopropylmalate synthase